MNFARPIPLLALVGLAGLCGACNGSALHQQIVAGQHAAALETIRGQDDGELEMALLICEAATGSAGDPGAPLERLGHAGRRGRPMLKRLEKSDNEEVRLLAQLYREGEKLRAIDAPQLYLGSGYSSVRTAFYRTFAEQLAPRALEGGLLDIDPQVRILALRALAARAPDDSLAQAARQAALKDPSPAVRRAAAENPSALGPEPEARAVLLQLLADEDLGIQLAAIRGLGRMGGAAAAEHLAHVAAGPLDELALAAAIELDQAYIETGRPVIDSALRAANPALRAAALLQLQRVNDRAIEGALENALTDDDPDVALLAAELAQPRGGRLARLAIEMAEKLYQQEQTSTPNRNRAGRLLTGAGHPQALADMKQMLSGTDAPAIAARLPLVVGIQALRPVFVELLAHPDASVRLQAAYGVILNSRT